MSLGLSLMFAPAGDDLFGAGSVVCALSTSAGQLIAARAFLGIGAALLVPVVMSLITVLFPAEAERKKAINFFVVSSGIGLPLGPIVAVCCWITTHGRRSSGSTFRSLWWQSPRSSR